MHALLVLLNNLHIFIGGAGLNFQKKSIRAASPLVFGFSCQQEYFIEKGEKLVKKNLVALRLQRAAKLSSGEGVKDES